MAANPDAFNDNIQESPGGSPVGLAGIYLILGYLLLFTVLALYSLVKIWPPIPEKEKQGNGNNANTAAVTGNNNNASQNTNGNSNQGSSRNDNGGAGDNSNAGGGNNNQQANTGSTPNANTVANTNTSAAATNNNSNVNASGSANANAKAKTASGGAVPQSEICKDENGNPRKGISPVSFFWASDTCIYDEDRLLLIVILAGALGALVHAVRSLSWYIGQRQLYKSWTAMYFLLPFLGALTALVFYFVARAGFLNATVEVTQTNPFGFAALAALIGMFTDQALQRLKAVAENILMPAPVGKNPAPPAAPLSLTTINPRTGPAGGGTDVVFTGTEFRPGARVTFGGVPATSVTVTSKTSITAKTPAHAAGTVDVEVINPDNQKAVLAGQFTYQ